VSAFDKQLDIGKVGESEIARWLMSRGSHVLPVYEVEKGQMAGPAVYAATGEKIIAPDILAFNSDGIVWVEAKHKTAFTWHRNTQKFTTGIDAHHFNEYKRIAGLVDWPVWLLFLHKGGQAKDSPVSPAGLFGNDLKYLAENINHTHENWGRSGMVYWAKDKLIKLSDYPINTNRAAA